MVLPPRDAKKVMFLQSLRFLFADWEERSERRRIKMRSPGESLLGSDFCFFEYFTISTIAIKKLIDIVPYRYIIVTNNFNLI